MKLNYEVVPVFVCAMRAREVKAQIQIYRP